jgi:hypothetical protein
LTLRVTTFIIWASSRACILYINGGRTKKRCGYNRTNFFGSWRLKQKIQTKGTHHAFDWETLDNPDVQVEIDWENEKEEHWS